MSSPPKWVAIESTGLGAAIDPQGAQLSLLRDARGRELLWDGDPAVWKGRAPVLFPIVGELAGGSYRLGTKVYRLPRHGFARNRRFELESSSGCAAQFCLAADRESLEVYPFRFRLTIRFELAGSVLSVKATIRNEGEESMPASFGYHPALRWPLPFGQPRSEHFIEFERDEPGPVRRLDSSGLLSPQLHATPISNRHLPLVDSLFESDALILDGVRSRRVVYGASRGPRIQVSFPDAAYLGVWSKRGADFICIEPWNGLADPQGFAGDFASKPGIFQIAPGTARTFEISLELLSNPPPADTRRGDGPTEG